MLHPVLDFIDYLLSSNSRSSSRRPTGATSQTLIRKSKFLQSLLFIRFSWSIFSNFGNIIGVWSCWGPLGGNVWNRDVDFWSLFPLKDYAQNFFLVSWRPLIKKIDASGVPRWSENMFLPVNADKIDKEEKKMLHESGEKGGLRCDFIVSQDHDSG